jgi:acetyl esterase
MLDPDIKRLLDTVFKTSSVPAAPDVALLRAGAEATPKLLGGDPETVATVHDVTAPGSTGRIAVRVYRPESAAPMPLFVYAHGGGWVTGSLDSHDRLCRILANRLSSVFVAVDYRCAPEAVYPAALDDVEAVWRWARGEAGALGADGTRFAVAGDSSGANLVAALTHRLRADGAAQPDLQLLFYPALDATCSRESYRTFDAGFNLSAAQMAWYWDAYCAGAAKDASELAPLAAADLAGLPPAVIAAAECDVLRDDAMAYARALQASGVATSLLDCTGMIHGFARWTGAVPAASRWVDVIAATARASLRM